MNRISRKAATLGAAGLLALAGIGSVVGSHTTHAAGPPAVSQQERGAESATDAASDTDQVQQEVQSGSQQDLGGPDKPESGQSTAPDTDLIQSQSGTDTP
jgi:hypothetical protein